MHPEAEGEEGEVVGEAEGSIMEEAMAKEVNRDTSHPPFKI